MAQREKVQVVNNTIEIEGEFAGGYTNGYLYYYDTNHQLLRPFTGQADTLSWWKISLISAQPLNGMLASCSAGLSRSAKIIQRFSLPVSPSPNQSP